jgi:hypothetical protein
MNAITAVGALKNPILWSKDTDLIHRLMKKSVFALTAKVISQKFTNAKSVVSIIPMTN